MSILTVHNMHSGYGNTEVIRGVTLCVSAGQIHGLFGRNGVGKTTIVRTIGGIIQPTQGCIVFDGKDISQSKPYEIARMGLAIVPETRDIFGSLSVKENLLLAKRVAKQHKGDYVWNIHNTLELFPQLTQRLDHAGYVLSGGEQQMLAIARALIHNPKVLILDEPTEGLAPIIVKHLIAILQTLKTHGLGILCIGQSLRLANTFCDYISVMNRGKIVQNSTRECFDAYLQSQSHTQ